MTSAELQELMDQAWDMAVERAADLYDIKPAFIDPTDGDYCRSDHQVVHNLQSEIFRELGGDLEEYWEAFCE